MTSDDDLLRSWAEATDPEHDPIAADEVRAFAEEIPLDVGTSSQGKVRRARSLAAAAAIVLVIGGAAAVALTTSGDEGPGGRTGRASSTTESTDPSVPADDAPGRLVVNYVIPDEVIFIEGALQFAEVRLDGEVVASGSGGYLGSGPVLDVEIAPGRYEVEGWLYQCPSSCPEPQPEPQDVPDGQRSEVCAAQVEVEPGRTTSVELRPFPSVDDLVSECEVVSGRPVQVVVSTGRLPTGREGAVHSYALRAAEQSGEGEVVAAGPLISNHSSMLVVDGTLPPGSYELVWEWSVCPASCPAVGSDGRPLDTGLVPSATCRADVIVDDHSIVEVHLQGGDLVEPDLPTTCAAEHPDDLPDLTVPPEWTLRQVVPQGCGDGSLRVVQIVEDTGWTVDQARRRCFVEHHQARLPLELRFRETTAGGASRWVNWRSVRGQFTVIREPVAGETAWTGQRCSLEVGPGPDDVRFGGCGVEYELPLDPP